jgi:hypothetical protein
MLAASLATAACGGASTQADAALDGDAVDAAQTGDGGSDGATAVPLTADETRLLGTWKLTRPLRDPFTLSITTTFRADRTATSVVEVVSSVCGVADTLTAPREWSAEFGRITWGNAMRCTGMSDTCSNTSDVRDLCALVASSGVMPFSVSGDTLSLSSTTTDEAGDYTRQP